MKKKRRAPMAYKIMLLGLLAIITILFARLVITGRLDAKTRDVMAVAAHRWNARLVLYLLVVFVLLLELRVRLNGGATLDWFLVTHLLFALPLFVVMVLLNYWFNGVQSAYHPWLAYTSAALFLGTLATGVPMIIFRL